MLVLAKCGIPTPLYLAPPVHLSSAEVDFRHAKTNDPNIFLGYEIFYLFYDETDQPVAEDTASAWESYAKSWLTPAALSNPNSSIMSYTKNNDPLFRRVYTGPDPLIGLSVVMFPVNPVTVSIPGGSSINFTLTRQADDTLLFTSSQAGVLSFPDDSGNHSYTQDELPVKRVVQRDGTSGFTIVDFFDLQINNDDDLSSSFIDITDLSVAFFAVTTGYDFGNRIVSDVVYIGSHNVL